MLLRQFDMIDISFSLFGRLKSQQQRHKVRLRRLLL